MSKRQHYDVDSDGFALNPQTNARFKYGERREDGAIFNAYKIKEGKVTCHFMTNKPTHKAGPSRSLNTVVSILWTRAKSRAMEKGIRFDLTHEWVRDNVQDAFLKGEIIIASQGTHKRNPRAASIDRIVPSLGYVQSNCRVVPVQLNMAKGDWDEESFLDILGPEVDRLRAKRQRLDE